jgi:hypothetical protein
METALSIYTQYLEMYPESHLALCRPLHLVDY